MVVEGVRRSSERYPAVENVAAFSAGAWTMTCTPLTLMRFMVPWMNAAGAEVEGRLTLQKVFNFGGLQWGCGVR